MKENEIDSMIREALSKEDAARFESLGGEESLFAQAIGLFQGRSRLFSFMAVVVMIDINQFGVIIKSNGRFVDIAVMVFSPFGLANHNGATLGSVSKGFLHIVNFNRPAFNTVSMTGDKIVDFTA